MSKNSFNDNLKVAMNMKVDKKPYISINKLAEFSEADAIRRRQIVKSLKQDVDFKKLYYSNVRRVLPNYFKSGYDNKKIENVIKTIEAKKSGTTWQDSDHPNSILALECLRDMDLPNLEEYEIVTDLAKLDHIYLSDVKVTIKPEIYLRHKKTKKVGGIKFHLAKTEKHRLGTTGLQSAGTIIKCGFLDQGLLEKQIDDRACISIDIFQQSFDCSPGAYKRNLGSLEANCEEIALRWNTI